MASRLTFVFALPCASTIGWLENADFGGGTEAWVGEGYAFQTAPGG